MLLSRSLALRGGDRQKGVAIQVLVLLCLKEGKMWACLYANSHKWINFRTIFLRGRQEGGQKWIVIQRS